MGSALLKQALSSSVLCACPWHRLGCLWEGQSREELVYQTQLHLRSLGRSSSLTLNLSGQAACFTLLFPVAHRSNRNCTSVQTIPQSSLPCLVCISNHKKWMESKCVQPVTKNTFSLLADSPQGLSVWRGRWCRTIETDLQPSPFCERHLSYSSAHLTEGYPRRCLLCFQSLCPAWLLYKSLENKTKHVTEFLLNSLLVWGVFSSSPPTW